MGIPLPWVWSWDPPVLISLALAAAFYGYGTAYGRRAGLIRRVPRWRVVAYASGLLAILLALESPLDAWSQLYLTAHMAQHELLLFVAAPLIVLGEPLMPVWRALPLTLRRTSLRWLLQHPLPRRLGPRIGHALTSPWLIWAVFVGDFIAWHLPALYDLALRHQTIHDLEHLLFLATGVLFWSQVIASAPLRPALDTGWRALYAFLAAMAMCLVAIAFVFVTTPIYPFYAQVARPAGAPSVIVDQTAAGGLMNVSTAIIFGLAFMLLIWKWLEEDERRGATLDYPAYRARAPSSPQPMFHGKPLRWQPIVLEGTAPPAPKPTADSPGQQPLTPDGYSTPA